MIRAIQEVQQFHIEPILFKIDKDQIRNSFKTASIIQNNIIPENNTTSKNMSNENNNIENGITDLIKKYFGNNGQK